jgi:hypothetical protein
MDTHTARPEGAKTLRTSPDLPPPIRLRLTYLDSLRTMLITGVVVAH